MNIKDNNNSNKFNSANELCINRKIFPLKDKRWNKWIKTQ